MTGDTNELADRINAAFQEVLSAEGNKLFCAIGLGEALKEAKEKIRQARKEAPAHLKPHVAKWPEWLKTYCRGISERTAKVYIQLEENKDKLPGKDTLVGEIGQRAADFSIRSALRLIQSDGEPAKFGSQRNAVPKQSSAAKKAATPDLTEMMCNVGPDEVRVALRDWSAADLRELRRYIDEMLGDEPSAGQVVPAPAPLAETRGWSTLLRRT